MVPGLVGEEGVGGGTGCGLVVDGDQGRAWGEWGPHPRDGGLCSLVLVA